jgi:regulator of sirC expression with transglutaminase-like and TPR domain
MSEILRCSVCRQEYELISAFNNEEEIVSQTMCACYKRLTKEKLDKAIEEVARRFNIKLKEVKNEKFVQFINQVSKVRKSNSKKQS